jgi:nuclear pore complex protein Nup85
VFKEAISVALISGDVPKVLRLASETDTWLSAHLCDLFSKLGLLEDPFGESTAGGEMEIGFRDHFILQYTDILLSDPGLWRIVVDYLASLDNVDIGRGRMREVLLSLGSTAKVGQSDEDNKEGMDGKAENAGEGDDRTAAATGDEAQLKSRKQTRIEDVLEACAQYGLEDVTRSLCLVRSLHCALSLHVKLIAGFARSRPQRV